MKREDVECMAREVLGDILCDKQIRIVAGVLSCSYVWERFTKDAIVSFIIALLRHQV